MQKILSAALVLLLSPISPCLARESVFDAISAADLGARLNRAHQGAPLPSKLVGDLQQTAHLLASADAAPLPGWESPPSAVPPLAPPFSDNPAQSPLVVTSAPSALPLPDRPPIPVPPDIVCPPPQGTGIAKEPLASRATVYKQAKAQGKLQPGMPTNSSVATSPDTPYPDNLKLPDRDSY